MKKLSLFLTTVITFSASSVIAGKFSLYNETPDAVTFKFYDNKAGEVHGAKKGVKSVASDKDMYDAPFCVALIEVTWKDQKATLVGPAAGDTCTNTGGLKATVENGSLVVKDNLKKQGWTVSYKK